MGQILIPSIESVEVPNRRKTPITLAPCQSRGLRLARDGIKYIPPPSHSSILIHPHPSSISDIINKLQNLDTGLA